MNDAGSLNITIPSPGDPNSLLSDNILCLYQDRSGKLWVGQVDGLSSFDPATEKFINYRNDPTDPATLGSNGVDAIYQDRCWHAVVWEMEGACCSADSTTRQTPSLT